MTEAPSIKEALELLPCPLCGSKFLMGREPHDNHPVEGKFYLFHDCSPLGSPAEKCPIDVRGHFNTAEEAAAIWNTRATLQPSGERREAIARCNYIGPCGWKGDLASGLVQNEAAIRKDEREKCAKIADREAEFWQDAESSSARIVAAAIRSARNGGTET